jgi:hypothetical protein
MWNELGGVDVMLPSVRLSSTLLLKPLLSLLMDTFKYRSGSGASSRASNVDVAPMLVFRDVEGVLVGLSLDRLRIKLC